MSMQSRRLNNTQTIILIPDPSQQHIINCQNQQIKELRLREKLLALIIRDLQRAQFKQIQCESGRNHIPFTTPDSSEKSFIRQSMAYRRLEIINSNRNWILKNENWILKNFTNGANVNPEGISPILEECTTQKQLDVFRYVRYYWSMPYSEYVGRRMKFLIRDESISNPPIIGIAALGSSIMQIRARDEEIGWTKKLRKTKAERIGNMMDIYVLGAIPPYSYLLGGKLICYMMASNEVRKAFKNKYKDQTTLIRKRQVSDLVMLATTSMYGKHSSQYNRVQYNNRLLYIPVGETLGFGSFQWGADTFETMRKYLELKGIEVSYKFGRGANWKMRVIRTCFDELKKDYGPETFNSNSDMLLQHSVPRGIYVIPLAENAREYLRAETDEIKYYDFPLEDMVNYWKDRWLRIRIRNQSVIEKVKMFKVSDLRHEISGCIQEQVQNVTLSFPLF